VLGTTWKLRPGSRWALVVSAALLTAAITGVAHAQNRGSMPSDDPLPSCLDQSITDELGDTLRPRGVQKRSFLKNKRIELLAHGGIFAADLLSSSYVYGGSLAFFLTEDFGVQVSFDAMRVALDLDEPVARFFGDARFEPGMGYLGLVNLLWSPVHAKLKIGDSIVHSDFLVTAGAGRLFHDSVQGVTFDAGLMLEMLVSKRVTIRFEIRDVIAVQEAVAETRLTNNIIATAGIGLWLPTGL
jgi:outer membrane beta-barrel protein